MNKEINIEQQLQAELTRLRKAVDYIEQAENTVQQIQKLNKDNQSKYEEILKSNENFKSFLDTQIAVINKKNEQIVTELNKLHNIITTQNKAIEQNKTEIERLKNLKWYQRLFGQK